MDSQQTTNHREIEEIAAAWLAKRDGGALTEAEEAEYTGWLEASIAHRVAILRLQAAWRQSDRIKALGAGTPPATIPAPGHWGLASVAEDVNADGTSIAQSGTTSIAAVEVEPRAARRASSRYGWAAGLLVAASSFTWLLWPQGPSYRTEIGGMAAVPMSDGSKVTLNTDSEIRVAVTDTERRVDLKQGEAFFEVAKDPARPFVVSVGDQRFVAVGTKFSVRRDADSVRLVVTEGRVRVERAGASAALPVAQVSAGGIARTSEGGTLLEEQPLPVAEEILSWRNGFLIFRGTPLEEAVAEFNRYNTRQIVIEDQAVAALRIGGNFRSTNVDAFVRLLEQGFAVHATERGNDVVLTAY